MFDFSNHRTNNLDQLHTFGIYELTRDYAAANGRVYPRGAEFWFDHAIVNMAAGQAEIHGSSAGEDEIVFLTRDNQHRELFSRTWLEWRPKPVKRPPPPPIPAGGERAWFLEQPGFEHAQRVLRGQYSRGHWDSSRDDADALAAAARLFRDSAPAVARWLAGESLNQYHSWMAQATSGGEGTAMQDQIRSELAEMRKLAGE